MTNPITRFRGPYAFLSNFHPCSIPVGELTAPSAEHAFQMLKTFEPDERRWICEAPTPAMAKRRGRKVTLRPDWNEVRLEMMEQVLRAKFSDPGLAAKLVATGDAELVEGNIWGDRFWGVYRGAGADHLGTFLMLVWVA